MPLCSCFLFRWNWRCFVLHKMRPLKCQKMSVSTNNLSKKLRNMPIASIKWPVMMHDSVQLSGLDKVGSGSSIPSCLTRSLVTSRPNMCAPFPWKSYGSNSPFILSSIGCNADPTPEYVRCMICALHESLFLLEGLLHAWIGLMWIPALHPF